MALFPKFVASIAANPANTAKHNDVSDFSSLATLADISDIELNRLEEEYYRLLQEFEALQWADGDDVPAELKELATPEIARLLAEVSSLYNRLHACGRNVPAKLPAYKTFDRNQWAAKYGSLISEAESMFHSLGGFEAAKKSCPELQDAEQAIDRAFYRASPKAQEISELLYRWKFQVNKLYELRQLSESLSLPFAEEKRAHLI